MAKKIARRAVLVPRGRGARGGRPKIAHLGHGAIGVVDTQAVYAFDVVAPPAVEAGVLSSLPIVRDAIFAAAAVAPLVIPLLHGKAPQVEAIFCAAIISTAEVLLVTFHQLYLIAYQPPDIRQPLIVLGGMKVAGLLALLAVFATLFIFVR